MQRLRACAVRPSVRPSAVGFPPFILEYWRDSRDGGGGGRRPRNATTALGAYRVPALALSEVAWLAHCRGRLAPPTLLARSADGRSTGGPRAVCLHLVASLLHFQLLSSVEGVEEAVFVQESKSGGAAPPLPPYPDIGELNLDGKTQKCIGQFIHLVARLDKTRREMSLSAARKFVVTRSKLPRRNSSEPRSRSAKG